MPGFTKRIARQHVFDGFLSLGDGVGDDHAFACGQAVGFDHQGGAQRFAVGQRGLNFSKVLIGRGRNVVTRQKIFGKGLGALQFGGGLSRPKDGQTFGFKQVDNPLDQRCFRANQGQGDVVVLSKFSQCFKFTDADRQVFALGFLCGPGIAWCNIDDVNVRVLSQLPGQGMFAAT